MNIVLHRHPFSLVCILVATFAVLLANSAGTSSLLGVGREPASSFTSRRSYFFLVLTTVPMFSNLIISFLNFIIITSFELFSGKAVSFVYHFILHWMLIE
jgi:hypothetical protein